MGFGISEVDMILITGATGFIGTHFVIALRKESIMFRALIHKHKPEWLAHEECIYGDLLEHIRLDDQGYKAVVHLAGGYSEALNIRGTENLLVSCKEIGTRQIIFLSSADVFICPQTPYAISKRQAEDKIRSSGIKYCIIRPSMVYGVGDHYIWPLFKMLKRYHVVLMPYRGLLRRPLYVDDLITRLIQLCREGDIPNYINIVGGEVIDVGEIYNAIQEIVGVNRIGISIPHGLLKATATIIKRARYLQYGMVNKDLILTDEKVVFGKTTFRDGVRKMAVYCQ